MVPVSDRLAGVLMDTAPVRPLGGPTIWYLSTHACASRNSPAACAGPGPPVARTSRWRIVRKRRILTRRARGDAGVVALVMIPRKARHLRGRRSCGRMSAIAMGLHQCRAVDPREAREGLDAQQHLDGTWARMAASPAASTHQPQAERVAPISRSPMLQTSSNRWIRRRRVYGSRLRTDTARVPRCACGAPAQPADLCR